MYRTAELMRDEEEYLNRCAVDAYKNCLTGDNTLSIERLLSYGKVIRRRVIRLGFIGFSPDLHDISYEQVESVLSLCDKENGKVIELVHGLRAAREYDCLRFYRYEEINDYCYELKLEEACYISEINAYALLSAKKIEKNVKICYTIALNCDTISCGLLLRNRRAGDKIYLSSINGHKSLKKLMSELRLNRRQRQLQPVLVCGDKLVSVCGYRVDECFAATEAEAALYFYLYKES
jgi:tRNA(Ile)-lysidine synthase